MGYMVAVTPVTVLGISGLYPTLISGQKILPNIELSDIV